MEVTNILFQGFLKCFAGINFNIIKRDAKSRESKEATCVQDSIFYLSKMLQRARKDLAIANKSHRAGKLSSEELFDYEWNVIELVQQIKIIEDLNKEQ